MRARVMEAIFTTIFTFAVLAASPVAVAPSFAIRTPSLAVLAAFLAICVAMAEKLFRR